MMNQLNRRDFISKVSKSAAFCAVPVHYHVAKSNKPKKMNKIEADALVAYLKNFTNTYLKFSKNHGLREIECLKVQYPYAFQPVKEGDFFAGRYHEPPLGFTPQAKAGSFGFYVIEDQLNTLLDKPEIEQEQKTTMHKLLQFWKTENTSYTTRAAYPTDMQTALPSDNWTGEPGIAFPLYRMSGTQLDYDKLLQKGIQGMREEIQKKMERTATADSPEMYQHMLLGLDLLRNMCLNYAAEIAQQQMDTNSKKGSEEYRELEKVLRSIAHRPPQTMREAMQLMYLYCVMAGSVNYGRMDEYLGDFYTRDLQAGRITEQEALVLIKGLWQLIDDRGWVFDSRVIIGGKGRRNEENANGFAMLALEASFQLRNVTPQLTLRFYRGQDERLMDKAISMIGEGIVYPMLYNDDVNIPAVSSAFNIPEKEAIHYVPFGCGEYTIYNKSVGTPSGVINLLQALNVTLHGGVDPKTGKKQGLDTGNPENFINFDSLLDAYKMQVAYHVEQLAYQEELEYKIAAQTSPFLFLSMLFDDCIERGKPVFEGGVRYLGGTLETYGNTNTADSLVAIKQLVYEEKRFTLNELITMLDADFIGYEKEKKLLLQAPKFGNDKKEADAMKVEVDRHVSQVTRNMKEKTGLHSYLIVIINNNANTVMGRHTAASADGRNAWTYMANGNAPTGGCDTNGVTAMLNSLVKPDIHVHAGAVQNMKFSKSLFTKHRPELEALLFTYFNNGGAQAMINVLNRDDLENAMKEPEKYSNLIVRVGGYCAKFVDLPRDVQAEVLSRTLY